MADTFLWKSIAAFDGVRFRNVAALEGKAPKYFMRTAVPMSRNQWDTILPVVQMRGAWVEPAKDTTWVAECWYVHTSNRYMTAADFLESITVEPCGPGSITEVLGMLDWISRTLRREGVRAEAKIDKVLAALRAMEVE